MAINPFHLMMARFFLGIAIGISSFAVPLYLAEISPAAIRGRLVSMFQLMVTIGILAAFLNDLFFANEMNNESWRNMFYAGVVPAIILLIGMLISPESPAWLISKNKDEAALKILSKLEEPDNVQIQFHLIKNELGKNKNAGWKEIFKPWLRNALIIAIGIMFFQQFVGINAVIYYSPRIFLMAGFGGNAAAITASAGIGIVNLLFTIVAIYFVDRLGRRKLFFIGMSGIILTLILLGFYFAFKTSAGGEGKWISVLLIFLYIIFFAISIGPLGWLIISEVFPLTVRGMGASVGSLAVWLFNAIVSFTFFKIINFFYVHG
jgi:SP family galactose:H+ symporter-like MFS transporter